MTSGRLRWGVITIVTIAVVISTIVLVNQRSRTGLRWRAGFLPGNPRRGGELFHDRGCAGCHAIAGIGGDDGPDLSRPDPAAPVDLSEIAASMWNHAPSMWEGIASGGYRTPELTPRDMADVMAFLFTAGYMDEGGSRSRGRAVLTRKGCPRCHAIGESGGGMGPDLTGWSSSVNPILWAQRSWNHAPAMEEAVEAEGLEWPQLTAGDVSDLLALLRSRVGTPRRLPPLPGEPWAGRGLFREHCQRCHRAEGEGGDVGPDLSEHPESRTLLGLAAALWNHAPTMRAKMRELGVSRPEFTEEEMADLIAYLFAIRYFEEPGNPDAGAGVYETKCQSCHGSRASGGLAPALDGLGEEASAIFMASTLWNHGPAMYRELQSRSLEWPRFETSEMRDLLAYLRALPQAGPGESSP